MGHEPNVEAIRAAGHDAHQLRLVIGSEAREFGQAEAYVKAGYQPDARSYRPAAQILAELKVKSIILLANNPEKAAELRKEAVAVSGTKELTSETRF